MDEITKGKINTAIGILQSLLPGDGGPVLKQTPFGDFFEDPLTGKKTPAELRDGKWIPVVVPEPVPVDPKTIWPTPDFQDFVFTGRESYAPDIRRHMQTCCDKGAGAAGLVAEIRTFWDKKDTFYQPIKDFIAMWPQYFPCETC